MSFNFSRLPAELRQMVLKSSNPSESLKHVRAGYASVSREWQDFFEPETFRRLVLDQERLPELEKMLARCPWRRDYIQQIHLRVKLEEYSCDTCHSAESNRQLMVRNNALFTKAVRDLVTMISEWPERKVRRNAPASERGIALDISFASPSDYNHACRQPHMDPSYPIWFDAEARADEALDFPSAQQRIISEAVTLQGGKLPQAPLVTSLSIRRQSYRQIKSTALKRLLAAFPNVSALTWEPWHPVTTTNLTSLNDSLPTHAANLKSLVLFQDRSHLGPDHFPHTPRSTRARRYLHLHCDSPRRRTNRQHHRGDPLLAAPQDAAPYHSALLPVCLRLPNLRRPRPRRPRGGLHARAAAHWLFGMPMLRRGDANANAAPGAAAAANMIAAPAANAAAAATAAANANANTATAAAPNAPAPIACRVDFIRRHTHTTAAARRSRLRTSWDWEGWFDVLEGEGGAGDVWREGTRAWGWGELVVVHKRLPPPPRVWRGGGGGGTWVEGVDAAVLDLGDGLDFGGDAAGVMHPVSTYQIKAEVRARFPGVERGVVDEDGHVVMEDEDGHVVMEDA
ncbi:hypothetical protein QBC34DRAFT_478095 [Podospora aff. communis PSN243]|uniref:F-box domain-containing protein n=1 Tax=Podospora aff. communis PSN243 TaxID=3040156 RepID=A0AAV9G314_9PEZI|nr:hypothetical protein QBC34DRAFT_478095 [Podospora aff. communis PSN243]